MRGVLLRAGFGQIRLRAFLAVSALLVATACASGQPPPAAGTSAGPAAPANAVDAPWLDRRRTFTLTPDASKATFRVQEQFLGVKLPEDAVGSTKALIGKITLTAEPAIVAEESFFEVETKSLRTDISMRDNAIKVSLRAYQVAKARFVPREVRGLPAVRSDDGAFKAQLVGEMSIREVTQPVTFDVDGFLRGNDLGGTARAELKMSDYGIDQPRAMDVAWVADQVRLEIEFAASGAD